MTLELDGRVVIVTGAGRGLGREHALLMAAEGARVVVNDLGGSSVGDGNDLTPAQETVEEIRAAGGTAIVNGDDVADWNGAKRLVEAALKEFGDLHVLVNNAGILRDRMIANMSEEEFDSVVRVHLRGHFCPTRHAAEFWRDQSKAGITVDRSLINTSSTSGLLGNVGQGNYGSAKAGIASMTIIANIEMRKYGVRANAIAPAARTRLTAATASTRVADAFDVGDPANVSPMVAYLATADCPLNGQVYFVHGGRIQLLKPWSLDEQIRADKRWTIAELRDATKGFAAKKFPTIEALSQ
jgi:NAD(P)-dependent dehydrogenase (short-subunit alcohol dehydrogenase family)